MTFLPSHFSGFSQFFPSLFETFSRMTNFSLGTISLDGQVRGGWSHPVWWWKTKNPCKRIVLTCLSFIFHPRLKGIIPDTPQDLYCIPSPPPPFREWIALYHIHHNEICRFIALYMQNVSPASRFLMPKHKNFTSVLWMNETVVE